MLLLSKSKLKEITKWYTSEDAQNVNFSLTKLKNNKILQWWQLLFFECLKVKGESPQWLQYDELFFIWTCTQTLSVVVETHITDSVLTRTWMTASAPQHRALESYEISEDNVYILDKQFKLLSSIFFPGLELFQRWLYEKWELTLRKTQADTCLRKRMWIPDLLFC